MRNLEIAYIPAGSKTWSNVVSTSVWRHDVKTTAYQRRYGVVTATLIQGCFDVACLLRMGHVDVDTTLFWRQVPAGIYFASQTHVVVAQKCMNMFIWALEPYFNRWIRQYSPSLHSKYLIFGIIELWTKCTLFMAYHDCKRKSDNRNMVCSIRAQWYWLVSLIS